MSNRLLARRRESAFSAARTAGAADSDLLGGGEQRPSRVRKWERGNPGEPTIDYDSPGNDIQVRCLCTADMTLSDKVFQALAAAIVSGRLKPGQRLDEPSVCREFGVSRTPVREALRRLGGTELVEMTPRKGVIVARISVEQLTDMYEALAEFEGLCARLSAVRMTALEKKRLELLNESRQGRLAKGDRDELAAINAEFHEAIYQGSHSPSISSVTRNFRQRIATFRILQFVPGQTEQAFRVHDEIVHAILASDADAACRAMRDHVTRVGLQAIENFSKQRFATTEPLALGERRFG